MGILDFAYASRYLQAAKITDGDFMQFHLTYEGPLYGSSKNDPRPDHKHKIRRIFHKQLKKLWSENQTLRDLPHGNYVNAPQIDPRIPRWQGLASRFQVGNYHFVPLVMEEMALSCSLDILFLRPDRPGNLIRSADIDARLKTLFDALKMPRETGQLGRCQDPGEEEDPFYCLLEDDGLIAHVSVTTDMLLEPTSATLSKNELINDARIVIDVKARPAHMTHGNIGFGA
jgi:hypothetical protein